ncbi:hypothetical protein KKB68_02055 [Patescibacteria group bacterium]|nr:hypothetical protein [Patescibacteria group bacterium]
MAEENIKQFKDEVIRHFDVVAEGLENKIGTVSEQIVANTETLETIKLDIEFIKNELKQKVSHNEFAFLEKRVSMLEAKIK